MSLPDAVANDTSARKRAIKEFVDRQHLMMTETYSTRTWKKPQQLQEDVIGSRVSGFKKAAFTGLATDVLPFHSYNDYLTLNAKDYHNPVSKGYDQYYKFKLVNELMQGGDTVWVLNFVPKGKNANELEGTVYINSDGYAISSLIASCSDTILKRDVRLEQQYERVTADGETHWFPRQLNYIIAWVLKQRTTTITYILKGNTQIDSVRWKEDLSFHFDKAHTMRLQPGADELKDTTWKILRPTALDKKEECTYRVIDSLGEKIHLDRTINMFSRIPEGKLTLGWFDVDLKRLFSYNYYENMRFGLGGQTSPALIKWLSVGAWAGYGIKDAQWKYGAFAEVYADRTREFVFKIGYEDNLSDPGRVHLDNDLDKNYLRSYLLRRVDDVKTYDLTIKKRLGYWKVALSAERQEIQPKYNYAFVNDGETYNRFNATEVSLNLRYAFAERTAPFFGQYYTAGTKYAIWYTKLTTGNLQNGAMNIPYTAAVSALTWHKHLNRIGNENFLIEGGAILSNDNLPLSKLFAGNGYKNDQESLYVFGGMMTMSPYDYYSDRFINFLYRHDFDWRLYKIKIPETPWSSSPFISLQYNLLYGKLSQPQVQQGVAFGVPDNAYHEAGLIVNSLLRLNYFNLYYFTLNIGYFTHITQDIDLSKNGRLVFGAGVDF